MDSEKNVIAVRENRKRRFTAAKMLADREIPVDLTWQQLLTLPEWFYWSDSVRQRLINICGALFIVPLIRSWIDGKKINEVRKYLSKAEFEMVITQNIELVSDNQNDVPRGSIQDTLTNSGATVLVSACNESNKLITREIFKMNQNEISHSIAVAILNRACQIIRKVDIGNSQSAQQGEQV